MKVGIVGLPNVGKSTLFNALTKNYSADAANFPFCTIEPNIGIVEVKDKRVDVLSEISQTETKIYAAIQFVDIAGLVKWASQGEGLGNKFLANIRETDAIVQVVRHFEDDDVVHVEWSPNPLRDVEIINDELMIADLQMVENILGWLHKKVKSWDADAKRLATVLEKIQTFLNQWKLAYEIKAELEEKDIQLLKPYNFLTYKPFVYAINVSEENLKNAEALKKEFEEKLQRPVAIVSAKFESEIMEMDADDKEMFLEDLKDGKDVELPTLDDLIKLAFDTVGLMYYFTTGKKETRAWTIPIASTAPQAAWAIHTDFERWFIKAETVSYDKFVEVGGWSGARDKGVLRLEGKTYIVQDGDVILFRFNT